MDSMVKKLSIEQIGISWVLRHTQATISLNEHLKLPNLQFSSLISTRESAQINEVLHQSPFTAMRTLALYCNFGSGGGL